MTNKYSSSLLTMMYVISVIILASLIIGFGTLTLIFLILGVVALVNPSARLGILHDILSGIGNVNSPWAILFAILFLLFIIAMSILIAWSVFKLIQNVQHKIFFETSTLRYIKGVLWGYGAIIIWDYLGSVIAGSFGLDIGTIGSDQSSSGISLLMWFALYAIYIIFKYGIQLQDDSNKIV
ncbi:hypothetical protein [Lentilactobacillus kisonensis]|nr:hypothetical protein [Lentilactobacillus kisonensis]